MSIQGKVGDVKLGKTRLKIVDSFETNNCSWISHEYSSSIIPHLLARNCYCNYNCYYVIIQWSIVVKPIIFYLSSMLICMKKNEKINKIWTYLLNIFIISFSCLISLASYWANTKFQVNYNSLLSNVSPILSHGSTTLLHWNWEL